tara:strand:+ start:379 stop:579 length:201 start_codon:yes stop_codon:yes gene_type:complete
MKKWIKVGLGWGIWMFLAMAFIWPLIDGEGITLKLTIIKFFYWILAGLGFGYLYNKYQIIKTKSKK